VFGYDDPVDDTPWLDDEEQRAWRSLVVASNRLKAILDAELVASHGLAFGDYEVLVVLSEAAEHRMRMSELAEELCLSPSGLTRRLDRLNRDGLVAREQCPADRRGSFAVLTPLGYARLEAAAPEHVRGVREHLLDHLDRHQMRVLGEALEPVAEACPWRAPARRPQVA
jgi:DNA-binding MarR family transcriptional regulator